MGEQVGPPVIEVRRLRRTYDVGDSPVHALQGVDLAVGRGEFVAVMGSSGSGKSTLMNVLGVLDDPSEGTYLLDGRDVSRLTRDEQAEVRNRSIGFVFQSFHLLGQLTAQRNVELPLLYAGVPRGQRRRQAADALRRVGLADRADHRPPQLSGGQQQRVAVARALVNEPALLLADEPTGNLDSVSTEDVMGLFADLHRDGRTVVVITHETDVAAWADRVVVLRDGRVASDTAQAPRRADHAAHGGHAAYGGHAAQDGHRAHATGDGTVVAP